MKQLITNNDNIDIITVFEYHPKCRNCECYVPIDEKNGLCIELNEVVRGDDMICIFYKERENDE